MKQENRMFVLLLLFVVCTFAKGEILFKNMTKDATFLTQLGSLSDYSIKSFQSIEITLVSWTVFGYDPIKKAPEKMSYLGIWSKGELQKIQITPQGSIPQIAVLEDGYIIGITWEGFSSSENNICVAFYDAITRLPVTFPSPIELPKGSDLLRVPQFSSKPSIFAIPQKSQFVVLWSDDKNIYLVQFKQNEKGLKQDNMIQVTKADEYTFYRSPMISLLPSGNFLIYYYNYTSISSSITYGYATFCEYLDSGLHINQQFSVFEEFSQLHFTSQPSFHQWTAALESTKTAMITWLSGTPENPEISQVYMGVYNYSTGRSLYSRVLVSRNSENFSFSDSKQLDPQVVGLEQTETFMILWTGSRPHYADLYAYIYSATNGKALLNEPILLSENEFSHTCLRYYPQIIAVESIEAFGVTWTGCDNCMFSSNQSTYATFISGKDGSLMPGHSLLLDNQEEIILDSPNLVPGNANSVLFSWVRNKNDFDPVELYIFEYQIESSNFTTYLIMGLIIFLIMCCLVTRYIKRRRMAVWTPIEFKEVEIEDL